MWHRILIHRLYASEKSITTITTPRETAEAGSEIRDAKRKRGDEEGTHRRATENEDMPLYMAPVGGGLPTWETTEVLRETQVQSLLPTTNLKKNTTS